jgi:hypothetical protein
MHAITTLGEGHLLGRAVVCGSTHAAPQCWLSCVSVLAKTLFSRQVVFGWLSSYRQREDLGRGSYSHVLAEDT